jgi:mono/diheme cytochrome c family protein
MDRVGALAACCALAVLALSYAPGHAAAQVTSAPPISFENDIQPIFDANCVVCHQSGSAQEGLDLEDGQAYASLVNKPSHQAPIPLVSPRSEQSSYLLHKLAGTQVAAHGRGERMPLGSELDVQETAKIRSWVLGGAYDN